MSPDPSWVSRVRAGHRGVGKLADQSGAYPLRECLAGSALALFAVLVAAQTSQFCVLMMTLVAAFVLVLAAGAGYG